MKTFDNNVCESCGQGFGCGANADGCWCVDVKLDPQITDDLNSRFRDCLCPACLRPLAGEPAIVVTYADGSNDVVRGAVRVDTDNFHEGMVDFYDAQGSLLKQIAMSANIEWKSIGPK